MSFVALFFRAAALELLPPSAVAGPAAAPAAAPAFRGDERLAGAAGSEPPLMKRRVCSHHSRSSEVNACGPSEGGLPRVSLVSFLPNVEAHAEVSWSHTVLYFVRKCKKFRKRTATA